MLSNFENFFLQHSRILRHIYRLDKNTVKVCSTIFSKPYYFVLNCIKHAKNKKTATV